MGMNNVMITYSDDYLGATDDDDSLGDAWPRSSDLFTAATKRRMFSSLRRTRGRGTRHLRFVSSRLVSIGVSRAGGMGKGTWSSCGRGEAGAARHGARTEDDSVRAETM